MLYNTKSNFLPLRSAGTAYSGGCVSVGFLLGNPSLSLSLFTDALWIGKGGYLQVVEQRVRLLCSLHTNILRDESSLFHSSYIPGMSGDHTVALMNMGHGVSVPLYVCGADPGWNGFLPHGVN